MRAAAFVVLVLGLGCARAAAGAELQVPDSLVFVRSGDLFRMTLDGSETVRLTTTKIEESDPAVSPDRLSIAYTRRDELWLVNAGGTGQRRLLKARPPSVRYASTGSPSWSADGTTLVFHRVSQTPNEICSSIFRIGAGGAGLKRLTAGVVRGFLELDPAVSPDGRRIALSSGECEPGFGAGLAVVDTAGRPTRDLRRLRATPGIQLEPAWAPDGVQIAFVVYDVDGSGRSAIYRANRDGTGLRRLTRWTFDTGAPAWSPDGQWIAFHKQGGLHLMRPDGSELERVPGTKTTDVDPAWLPRS